MTDGYFPSLSVLFLMAKNGIQFCLKLKFIREHKHISAGSRGLDSVTVLFNLIVDASIVTVYKRVLLFCVVRRTISAVTFVTPDVR